MRLTFESRLMGRSARPRSKSQLFCRYCIPRRFSTLSLKSTSRARLCKSDVYSLDYDNSIVKSVLLLDCCVVISIGCMLPADLATYLSNLLTGLLAHQCARAAGKMKETKGRCDNDGNNECIRDRPERSYEDYRLIVGKENILNSAIFYKCLN